MNDVRRWLCLDCGKNTFEHPDDYYILRNRLWRRLVPRDQRHGMICRACIERRVGRSLTQDDFRKATDDESAPEDQPMQREDYGIVDSLTPAALYAIDSAMIAFASARPRKVIAIVRHMCELSPAAEPGLPEGSRCRVPDSRPNLSGGQKPAGFFHRSLPLLWDKVGSPRFAPARHVHDQPFSLGNALLRRRFVDVVARVVRYVPLPPQGVEHDNSLGRDADRERQTLDNGHVGASSSAPAPLVDSYRVGTVHHQCGQRTLHTLLYRPRRSAFRG